MKKILSIILSVVMLVSIMATTTVSADTNLNSYQNYTLGTTVTGYITENTDANVYRFELSSSGKVSILFNQYFDKVDVHIYDIDGNKLYTNNLHWNKNTKKATINENIYLHKGTYFFSLERDEWYESTGKYDLKLSFTSSGESFTETISDNDNSVTTANKISLNTLYKGVLTIAEEKDNDNYYFSITSSGKIQIILNQYFDASTVIIYDENGEIIYREYLRWNENTKKGTINEGIYLYKGNYYFSVERDTWYDSVGNYDFRLNFTSSGESFTETLTSNNNSVSSANRIAIGKTYKGVIVDAYETDNDNYVFSISSSTTLTLNFNGWLEKTRIQIFDINGDDIFSEYVYDNDATKVIKYKKDITLNAGTYYLSIDREYCSGNYTFKLNYKIYKPTKPATPTKAIKKGKVKLSWSPASYAAGYQIQFSRNKNFKKLVVNKKQTKTTFSKKLSRRKTFHIRIRSYKVINGTTYYSGWRKFKLKTK